MLILLRCIFFSFCLFGCFHNPVYGQEVSGQEESNIDDHSLLSKNDDLLKVVYPRSSGEIEAPSTFIVGQIKCSNPLTCNGSTVKVNKSGFFAHVVPLHYGANHFQLSCSSIRANSSEASKALISRELVIYRKAPAKPIGPNELKLVKPKPDVNIGVRPGDIVNFSVHATPNSTVNVQLGERLVNLIPIKRFSADLSPDVTYGKVVQAYSPDQHTYSDLYKGSYGIGEEDHFFAVQPKFILTHGNKSLSSIGKNTIYTVDKFATAQTAKAPTVVRLGPGLARTTPLVENVKVLIDGWSGDNMRCIYSPNHHVWIKRQDLIATNNDNEETTSPKTFSLKESLEQKNRSSNVASQAVARTINIMSDQYGEQVCLPLNERLPYQIEQKLNPNSLILWIYGVSSDTDWITSEPSANNQDISIINHVSWRQPEDNVYEVTIHLNGKRQWGYKIFYNGNTLCLAVKRPAKIAHAQADSDHSLNGLKICLDPGHGGKENGATGCSGMPESQLNLEIATKVKSCLESLGATVIMTRSSQNETLSLDERVRIATDAQADLLISIHNNALPDGRDPWQEHGTSSYWYHPQSIELARCLKNAVKEASGFPDLGARYQNLALARAQAMPSVLLEIGFMIHPDEFANLIDAQWQMKIARAISNGVKQYIDNSP